MPISKAVDAQSRLNLYWSYTRGGGVSFFIFSSYVGLDLAKIIKNIMHPKKNILNFSNPKNIPILYIYLKKDPKCIEMTHKTRLIL